MVEEVCREAEERKAKGIAQVPVSINFSRNDFDQRDSGQDYQALYAAINEKLEVFKKAAE